MGETTKRWWETLGGIMTGVAALITAGTGLIVALYTLDRPESRSRSSVTAAPITASNISETNKTADEAKGAPPECLTAQEPRNLLTRSLCPRTRSTYWVRKDKRRDTNCNRRSFHPLPPKRTFSGFMCDLRTCPKIQTAGCISSRACFDW